MAKMAKGIVSVQEVILTMCLLESSEKEEKLKDCVKAMRKSRDKLKEKNKQKEKQNDQKAMA